MASTTTTEIPESIVLPSKLPHQEIVKSIYPVGPLDSIEEGPYYFSQPRLEERWFEDEEPEWVGEENEKEGIIASGKSSKHNPDPIHPFITWVATSSSQPNGAVPPCDVPFTEAEVDQWAQGTLIGYKYEGHENNATLLRWRGIVPQRRVEVRCNGILDLTPIDNAIVAAAFVVGEIAETACTRCACGYDSPEYPEKQTNEPRLTLEIEAF
ncbi:hypothetical protein ACMFMG_002276 [Clarireedia jacksonii]